MLICKHHKCRGPDHPVQLNLKKVRHEIPHTLGENPPNSQGYLLCNGHCSWKKKSCTGASWICLDCGYLECQGCAEDFIIELEEKIFPELLGYGTADYCRGCGKHRTMYEIGPDDTWIKKQVGIIEDIHKQSSEDIYPSFDPKIREKIMVLELTKQQAEYLYQLKKTFEDYQGVSYEGGAYGEINSFAFINDIIRFATWWWSNSTLYKPGQFEKLMKRYRNKLPRDYHQNERYRLPRVGHYEELMNYVFEIEGPDKIKAWMKLRGDKKVELGNEWRTDRSIWCNAPLPPDFWGEGLTNEFADHIKCCNEKDKCDGFHKVAQAYNIELSEHGSRSRTMYLTWHDSYEQR